MPPRRPPPLPKSLFQGDGPLALGSAPLPPSPSNVHPTFIIDAHALAAAAADHLYEGLHSGMPRPPVKAVVEVVPASDAIPDVPSSSAVATETLRIHPTVLNLSLPATPIMANVAKSAVDIVIPSSHPLTEHEWDLLDDAVKGIEESWSTAGITAAVAGVSLAEQDKSAVQNSGKIVISGLLPPPLTTPSDQLSKDPDYDTFIARLNQLSLHSIIHLKALPPTAEEAESWTTDSKELERVLKMYLSPAIESFGTHRIIFGSASVDTNAPASEKGWYALLRKVLTELGEGADAVNGVFGGNAAKVYDLH